MFAKVTRDSSLWKVFPEGRVPVRSARWGDLAYLELARCTDEQLRQLSIILCEDRPEMAKSLEEDFSQANMLIPVHPSVILELYIPRSSSSPFGDDQ